MPMEEGQNRVFWKPKKSAMLGYLMKYCITMCHSPNSPHLINELCQFHCIKLLEFSDFKKDCNNQRRSWHTRCIDQDHQNPLKRRECHDPKEVYGQKDKSARDF
jgi:hypothetical protein